MKYKKDDVLKSMEQNSQDDYSQTQVKVPKKSTGPKRYGKVTNVNQSSLYFLRLLNIWKLI